MGERGPGAAGGFVLIVVAVVLGWMLVHAFTAPVPLFIEGYVVGPCDVVPSSTAIVLADNEEVGRGAVGVSNWARDCSGTISANGLEPADVYTVDAGPMSGTVTADRVGGMPVIKLTEED